MKTTQTFSVDIIIRRNKKDKEKALLYARITVDGDVKEVSLKESISVNEWDSISESVTGKSIRVKSVNQMIEDSRFKIREKYLALRESDAEITADLLKSVFLGIDQTLKGHTILQLLAYFKKIWGAKMKPGGFKNYKTTIGYIVAFLKDNNKGKDIYLKQVSMQLVTDLEYYIRNKPLKAYDPCLGNGVAKHIQRLKRIMNWAAEINWIKGNAIEYYKCPLKKNRRKKLSMEELVKLEQKSFLDSSLNYVKDLFLFACYTSFAFVDVMTLVEEDFEFQGKQIWCKKYRVKSEELQMVLLLKDATVILNKYRNDPAVKERKTIFPYQTNQYVNRCLRIIQEACEIVTPMTFHVARHTFAKTVALKNGVPMETIQMIMGILN